MAVGSVVNMQNDARYGKTESYLQNYNFNDNTFNYEVFASGDIKAEYEVVF